MNPHIISRWILLAHIKHPLYPFKRALAGANGVAACIVGIEELAQFESVFTWRLPIHVVAETGGVEEGLEI